MASEAPKVKPTEITRELFQEWTRKCGVRRVQQPYEEMAQEAKRQGRSAPEEMKLKGFKDFHEFSQACPRFDLFCWPEEFAELGSGYVLYFHLLAFLAGVLLLIFFLQVPAMAVYARDQSLCEWSSMTDWRLLFRKWGDGQEVLPCTSNDGFIRSSLLTPGNVGPDAVSVAYVPTLYTVCVAILAGLMFVAYQHQVFTDYKVDQGLESPNDFAVLVRDLPQTATDEKAIADWFKQNAIAGTSDTEIVKVVIGWDATDFRDKIKELKTLQDARKDLAPDDPELEVIAAKFKAIQDDLNSIASNKGAKLRSSGRAVVIFRRSKDMQACLRRWGSLQAMWLYREPKDISWLPAGNHLLAGEQLPRFPTGSPPMEVIRIQIERAANPGDIHWEELGVDLQTKLKMQASTNFRMFVVIAISFGITWGFNALQDTIAKKRQAGASAALQIVAIIPAIGTAVLNVILCVVARREVAREYHDTHTDEEFSLALKITVGMLVNTVGVTYFCNARPEEWYKSGGLVDDLYILLLVHGFLLPILSWVDIGYQIKYFRRRKLTDEVIRQMNANIQKGPPKSADDQKERLKVLRMIEYFKEAYAPPSMNNSRRYANTLKTFVTSLFFSPVMPWMSLIGFCGLTLQYVTDKYLLLRWQCRPAKPANSNLSMFSLQAVKVVAPLGLAVTAFVFLCPSWDNKAQVWSNFYTSLAIAVLVCFLMPSSVWARIILPCMAAWVDDDREADYYEAQYKWPKEMKYHKDQFIYKKLPESINPEYLQPGVYTAVQDDARQAALSEATKHAAAEVEAGTGGPAVMLPGGRIVAEAPDGGMVGPLSPPGGGSGGSGPPTTVYGVPAAPGVAFPEEPKAEAPVPADRPPPHPEPEVAPSAPLVMTLPPTTPEISSEPAGATEAPYAMPGAPPSPTESGRVIWEFEVKTGWEAFHTDCQSYIENRYQHFLTGTGKQHITVNTQGLKVSVFFDKMTSKLEGKRDRVRAIRRKDSE